MTFGNQQQPENDTKKRQLSVDLGGVYCLHNNRLMNDIHRSPPSLDC